MGSAGPAGIAAETLTNVAMLYWREGLTQGEIARRVGLSRATVVHFLRLARETGIVDIRINGDAFAASRLARDLAARWGLAAAFVASSHGTDDTGNAPSTLTQMAAIALHDLVPPGARLGVAWGDTVRRVADALPIRPVAGLVVHQIVGAMQDRHHHAAENCTVEIARRCAAECRTLPAPAILSSADLARALRAEPVIAEQLAAFDGLTHVTFSVGDTGPATTLVTSGIASAEAVAGHAAGGARAILRGHFIDAAGRAIDSALGTRMIGITPAQLARIPNRLPVAGGLAKTEALRALLEGGYASHLMVDERNAERLLA